MVESIIADVSGPHNRHSALQTSLGDGAQRRESNCRAKRVFLLSPANASGVRGRLILNKNARFDLALRLRRDGLPLGELFSFISGLYFRGKLAYARAFAQAPPGMPGVWVITAGRGLVPADQVVSMAELREMLRVPIEPSDPRYRLPLERAARILAGRAGKRCEVVLLGSIASPKYVEPLLPVLGKRLLFPAEFVGRGDMSRGGLMLRQARTGIPLNHIPVGTAVRRGTRPPKLPKLATNPKPQTNAKLA